MARTMKQAQTFRRLRQRGLVDWTRGHSFELSRRAGFDYRNCQVTGHVGDDGEIAFLYAVRTQEAGWDAPRELVERAKRGAAARLREMGFEVKC
jgi:hypothetical protein